MHYDEFVRRVEHLAAGGLQQADAERAIRATLATLAEQISRKEAADLAAQLPKELKRSLQSAGAAKGRPLEGFLHRAAERQELSSSEAFHRARAVMGVLAQAVTGHELDDVRAELGGDFDALFQRSAAARWPDSHSSPPHP